MVMMSLSGCSPETYRTTNTCPTWPTAGQKVAAELQVACPPTKVVAGVVFPTRCPELYGWLGRVAVFKDQLDISRGR